MFDPEARRRIRELLTEKAWSDPAVVAAAAVGSTATDPDRWSDLDLTFGVAPGTTVEAILDRWTRDVTAEFGAAVLFDLPVGSTIYRVFLFPGALQVDLSFTPAAEFGARGPRFQLCSARQSNCRFGRRHHRSTPSGSGFTTRSARTSASPAAGTGRRSTGS